MNVEDIDSIAVTHFMTSMPRRILSSAKPEIMIIFSSYRLLMANVLFP